MAFVRLFVLCAPVRSRTPAQLAEQREVKARIVAAGGVPLFLPDTLTGLLDDEIPSERATALAGSDAFVRAIARGDASAQMVIVGNVMSEGMRLDIESWQDATGGTRPPITPVRALRMLGADQGEGD